MESEEPSFVSVVNPQKRERFEKSREREFFQKYLTKPVFVTTPGGTVAGKLVWVDVYTLGVLMENRKKPSIIWKGPGVVLHPVE